MTAPSSPTPIFHITHVDNLPLILDDDGLMSDAEMIERGGPEVAVGMSSIKQRRLTLRVACHGGYVGDCVPFYFCPRSIMLSVLYYANHPELAYRGGQRPIVHLRYDMGAVIDWAEANSARWAFSLSNAGAAYAEFRNDRSDLHEINWTAVAATDFRSAAVKEGKQAEFLVERFVPWSLVDRIGVHNAEIRAQVLASIAGASHQPDVAIQPRWYF